MADYRELGIELPEPTPLDKFAENPRNLMFQQARNAQVLSGIAFGEHRELLPEALAVARDLENQILLGISLEPPESQIERLVRYQQQALLDKLPPLNDKWQHEFTHPAKRKDFEDAGIDPELVKIFMWDGGYIRNNSGTFVLSMNKERLKLRNQLCKVSFVLDLNRVGIFAISPLRTILEHHDEKFFTEATDLLKDFDNRSNYDDPSLYITGAKLRAATALQNIAGKITDSYVSTFAPLFKKAS